MPKRIQMNSASLQERFPETYREFFSQCPIVVSAPGNFWWSGEYSVLLGGLAIKQNLPLRTYVGIEPCEENKIEIQEALILIPSKRKFEKWLLPKTMQIKTKRFVDQFIHKNISQKKYPSFRIHILFEVPPECGLAASGSFAAAFSLALHLFLKQIDLAEIKKWPQKSIFELTKDNAFNRVFKFAWDLESIYHNNSSSGTAPFCSLVGSLYPIIFFLSKNKNIKTLNYYGFKIDELINLEKKKPILDLNQMPNWPIDFGLIYSGDICSTEIAMKSQETLIAFLRDIKNRWQRILKQQIFQEKPYFFKIMSRRNQPLNESYLRAMALISLEVFHGLNWIFKSGNSDEALEYLFEVINANQSLLSVSDVSSPFLNHLCSRIDQITKELGDNLGAGAKLTGRGVKGDILFVVNYHGLRDNIDKIISQLREETKENIWLDYASWLDGLEEEGVKIEQHLAEKNYSKFISKGSVSLKSFGKEEEAKSELISLEDFEKEKPEIDILLDISEEDIYVKGKKLSSKEIHSSSMTVEILNILLKNLEQNISCQEFSISSYSHDRNEMQSKIISPLIKIIKKKTGKILPLEISGGLTNFKLRLDPSNLDIRILDKIF